MNVVLHIPDEFAEKLGGANAIEREALEVFAVQAYRDGRLTEAELQRLLGFGTRYQLDGFLKARGVFHDYTMADLEQERRDLERLASDQ